MSDALGRDAPTARPQLPPSAPQPEPRPTPEPEVTPPPRQEVKPVAAEVKQPPKPIIIDEAAPETDEGSLGELFDLGSRAKTEPREEKAAANAESKGEGSTLRIPLTHQAPSWDDAPLPEGDFWQRLYNLKLKYWKVGAAMAGICLLAVIALAVAAKLQSSRNGDAEPPVAAPSEPAEASTPQAASDASVAAPEKAVSVYTENLVPPPDSYVD